MANALCQSKLIGSAFFVILHSNFFFKLLFGLGKCCFWLVSWQFFHSFFWRPQIHKLSQTPLSFHWLSRKAYPIFPKLSKTFEDCANPALPSWCQMSWWTFRFTLTHNTELSSCQDMSLYEKLSTPQNLVYLKQSLGEIPGEDCWLLSTIWCMWWNRAISFTSSGSVFDPLLAVICFW